MPLSAGTRLGPYEILSPIGAGGMGEVYRARDTRLDRTVAVKISAEQFSERFEREARAVAALNHPNICTLHDVGPNYLVMEFIDGPTLAERIAGGPVPLDEALPVARQIAEALEAAHEKGIVHRDLKPANIKLTPEGAVKVLDFGLAKAFDGETTSNSANSPTLTIGSTRAGMILGTAGYMSPEQAKGKPVDKRADIWSFGIVLMEMLGGRLIYDGETIAETLAAVIKDEPSWSVLPADTPAYIRRLLRRCLDKDPRQRLRDIGEARIALLNVAGATEAAPAAAPLPARPSRLPYVAAFVLGVLALGAAALWWSATRPVSRPMVRLRVDLGANLSTSSAGPNTIVSPDGTRIVYLAAGADGKERLFTRALDQLQPSALAGTENADAAFFSPDGQWVAFHADDKLKKILVQGGGAVTLCTAQVFRGASWGDDGNIIAALRTNGGLARVPPTGGNPEVVTRIAAGERTHRWPQVLPGSEAVLFMSSTAAGGYEDANIEVQSLRSGQRKVLHRGGYFPHYLPSGHLLYMRDGVLFAAPMDLKTLALTGPPVPALEDVDGFPTNGGARFDFSRTGTFVYFPGDSATPARSLVWFDGTGKADPLRVKPGIFSAPRLSPDGKRVLLAINTGGIYDVWAYDWERDIMTRLTFGPRNNRFAIWTPDARGIVYSSADGQGLFWLRADGTGTARQLTRGVRGPQFAESFSPEGKRLVFCEQTTNTNFDLFTVDIDWSDENQPKAAEPQVFLATSSNESAAAVSPDGRWLAYHSNETGTFEVYVRPFAGASAGDRGKWQISSGGASSPRWVRGARELVYRTRDGRIMAASYTVAGDSFSAAKPRLWCEKPLLDPSTFTFQLFDLAPDGKRVIAVAAAAGGEAQQKSATQVIFLQNYFDELRRRAPVR